MTIKLDLREFLDATSLIDILKNTLENDNKRIKRENENLDPDSLARHTNDFLEKHNNHFINKCTKVLEKLEEALGEARKEYYKED